MIDHLYVIKRNTEKTPQTELKNRKTINELIKNMNSEKHSKE